MGLSIIKKRIIRYNRIDHFFICIIALNIVYTFVLCFAESFPNSFSHIKWLTYDQTSYNDSWGPMITALHHINESSEESVYQSLLIDEGVKFQYPPSSLIIFDLPERFGFKDYQIVKALDILSLVSFFLVAVVSSKILTLALQRYRFGDPGISSASVPIVQHLLILLLTLLFYPLVWSYHVGQIQTFLTLITTFAIFFWLRDQKQITGVLFGLICLVKPQLGLIFLWGIIRRQWAMVAAGGLTVLSGLLLSVNLYGFKNNWDYLAALSFLSQHGESYYANQSINGLMNRLLFNGDNLLWNDDGFPPFSFPVYLTTLLSSLVLISMGLLWNYKKKNPTVIDLSIMLLCTTIASPIAWEHHYGILLPIFVLIAPFVLYYFQSSKWKLALFALAFVVASQYLHIVSRLSNSYWNFLQSYLFFSALVILVFIFSISKKIKKLCLIAPPGR